MIDTLAIMTQLDYTLSDHLFQGMSVVERFEDKQVNARLYRNPVRGSDFYEPRVTYWSNSGYLKVEFSLQKMVKQSNLSMDAMLIGLRMVSQWVRQNFGVDVPIEQWTVQRVDYTWDFEVDDVDVYLHHLRKMSISGYTAHPQKDGMLWKSGNRWIKFYRKDDSTLRYEVSNYRSAVKYMCVNWFVCERVVYDLVHAGRALFVLAYFWDKLGLTYAQLGGDVVVARRLRECFGAGRVAGAFYALYCLCTFGVDTYKRFDLMSSSMYYKWKSELHLNGFVYIDVDDDELVERVPFELPQLVLPVERVIADARENLKSFSGAGAPSLLKNFSQISQIWGVSETQTLPKLLGGEHAI